MKLEQNILDLARQRLKELESFAKDHDDLDEVVLAYGRVMGLVELGSINDSGLSKDANVELEGIDLKAMQIMGGLRKTENGDHGKNQMAIEFDDRQEECDKHEQILKELDDLISKMADDFLESRSAGSHFRPEDLASHISFKYGFAINKGALQDYLSKRKSEGVIDSQGSVYIVTGQAAESAESISKEDNSMGAGY